MVMKSKFSVCFVAFGLILCTQMISVETCTVDSDCGEEECCTRPRFGSGIRTCRRLSTVGEACPAYSNHFSGADVCGCDSSSVCRVPITGIQPIYGYCKAKPELLPGGRCFTNRNCNFGACCVIKRFIDEIPLRPASQSAPQPSDRVALAAARQRRSSSDWPQGTCMRKGQWKQMCTASSGADVHIGACPCTEFSSCLKAVADLGGEPKEHRLPPPLTAGFGTCSFPIYPA